MSYHQLIWLILHKLILLIYNIPNYLNQMKKSILLLPNLKKSNLSNLNKMMITWLKPLCLIMKIKEVLKTPVEKEGESQHVVPPNLLLHVFLEILQRKKALWTLLLTKL